MFDPTNDLDITFLDLVSRIERHLSEIAEYMAPAAPNWTHDIAEFAGFDWRAIGATVAKADDYGPSAVEWRGKLYTRRSPQNKFGAAIWFSRPAGKTEDGSVRYERLITFKPMSEAEPISREAEKQVRSAPPRATAPRPTHPAPAPAPALVEPEFGPDGFESLTSATEDPAIRSALAQAQAGNGKRPDWLEATYQATEEGKARAAFEAQRAAFEAQRTSPAPAPPAPSQDRALDHALDQQAGTTDLTALTALMHSLAGSATNQDAAAAIVRSASGQLNGAHAEKALNSAIVALRKMQPMNGRT